MVLIKFRLSSIFEKAAARSSAANPPLSRQLQKVTLPIDGVGNVNFKTATLAADANSVPSF